jgi:glutamyl-tRNA synthetase
VANWIALMGWSYDDHTEIFTNQDLIEKFSLEHLNPAPAAINFSKLDHFNGVHIRGLAPADLAARIKPFLETAGYVVDDHKLLKAIPIIQVRLVTLDDAVDFAGFFFKDTVNPPVEELIGKNMSAAQSAEVARRAYDLLASLDEISPESAGQFFGILRVAITGQTVSPPLLESMHIIGKEVVLERIRTAAERLELI